MTDPETGLRDEILQAATRLFVEKGYHAMSMREIAEAVGVSKAALYYHFRDKEELFVAILDLHLDDMSAELDRIMARGVSCREQVRLFMEYVLRQPGQRRATIRLASQEIAQLSPERRAEFGGIYRRRFTDKLKAILQRGMERGELRPINADTATRALLGLMYPYMTAAQPADSPVPARTIKEVIEIYLKGIAR